MADDDLAYDGPIVTLQEATRLRLRFYFTGKPCARAHLAQRKVSDRSCLVCKRINKRDAYRRDPEKFRAECARRWRRNPEQSRERSRVKNLERYHRLKLDDAYRERLNEYGRRRRSDNIEARREQSARSARKRRQERLDEMRARGRANQQRRRAAKRGAEDSCTAKEIEALRSVAGKRCAHCGVKASKPLTIDHIKPLARGGAHSIRNIQFLCSSCNSSKNARDPIEFARSVGRLL